MRWMAPVGVAERKAMAGAPVQMATYQLFLLKAVSGRSMSAEKQRSHMLHMDEMAKSGELTACPTGLIDQHNPGATSARDRDSEYRRRNPPMS